MVIEMPALADGNGIHPHICDALPTAVASMISTQGAIHKLVIEAYEEKSRNKLLQAMLLDPTISSYNNAVALINDMCELQKELLPPMHW
jgi:alpha-galactosidase